MQSHDIKEKFDKNNQIVITARGDNRKIMEKVYYWLKKDYGLIDIDENWKNEVGMWRFLSGTEKAIEWIFLKNGKQKT